MIEGRPRESLVDYENPIEVSEKEHDAIRANVLNQALTIDTY